MRTTEVQNLVGRVAAVDASCTDWGVLKAVIADVRTLKSWLESREVSFAQQVAKVSSFPEKSLAEAANTSVRDGGRLLQRAETAAALPEFGVSLDEGRMSGEHLDVDHHTRTQPRTHDHTSRRTDHDHRTTQTRRGMIRCGPRPAIGAHR